jgi:L-amino acid N-acyltransferase YncA
MKNQINVRELKKEDVEAVEKIYDLYWFDDFRQKLSQKLNDFVNHLENSIKQNFQYFIAERSGEVVGVAVVRKLPEHMKNYAKTANPAEFYVIAVKYQRQGIGEMLRNKRIEEVKKSGYTEVLFFSGEKHKDSWAFHDKSGFKRIGVATAPNGEKGQMWQMIF